MCYTAQVWADYRRYIRDFGAELDIKEYYEHEPVTYQSVIKGLSSPSSSE